MATRKIIKIDENKCNGCGLCAEACHEGAIGMVNGKATLLRDDYCDGLGDCLPVCPTNAISFEEREAAAYDEAAVQARMKKAGKAPQGGCPGHSAHTIAHESGTLACGCPGSHSKTIAREAKFSAAPATQAAKSMLAQWPVQIKLVPVNAPYFKGAKLLIAADCTSFAYGDFHNRFIKNHITLIGCPKLDEGDYAEKLTAILKENDIQSVTVVRMEVPCCGGIANAVVTALKNSGKMIPWQIVTISTDGTIIEE
ncbi:4Fe-4S binding protein [Christensenellaceae bacterium OttesenSCG-928-L17]|nr:4Fe-4S binding protein [Christensenellaceae bacterium OttesenSCG-928-L17]